MPKWSNSRKAALKQRLRKRIEKQDKPNGCWLWTGARTADGHGAIHVSGKTYYVHRLAYELWVGPFRNESGSCIDATLRHAAIPNICTQVKPR